MVLGSPRLDEILVKFKRDTFTHESFLLFIIVLNETRVIDATVIWSGLFILVRTEQLAAQLLHVQRSQAVADQHRNWQRDEGVLGSLYLQELRRQPNENEDEKQRTFRWVQCSLNIKMIRLS